MTAIFIKVVAGVGAFLGITHCQDSETTRKAAPTFGAKDAESVIEKYADQDGLSDEDEKSLGLKVYRDRSVTHRLEGYLASDLWEGILGVQDKNRLALLTRDMKTEQGMRSVRIFSDEFFQNLGGRFGIRPAQEKISLLLRDLAIIEELPSKDVTFQDHDPRVFHNHDPGVPRPG